MNRHNANLIHTIEYQYKAKAEAKAKLLHAVATDPRYTNLKPIDISGGNTVEQYSYWFSRSSTGMLMEEDDTTSIPLMRLLKLVDDLTSLGMAPSALYGEFLDYVIERDLYAGLDVATFFKLLGFKDNLEGVRQ